LPRLAGLRAFFAAFLVDFLAAFLVDFFAAFLVDFFAAFLVDFLAAFFAPFFAAFFAAAMIKLASGRFCSLPFPRWKGERTRLTVPRHDEIARYTASRRRVQAETRAQSCASREGADSPRDVAAVIDSGGIARHALDALDAERKGGVAAATADFRCSLGRTIATRYR